MPDAPSVPDAPPDDPDAPTPGDSTAPTGDSTAPTGDSTAPTVADSPPVARGNDHAGRATVGLGPLRDAPDGMPDPRVTPPTVGESGDPFTTLRVVDLLARIERGRPTRIADIAARLNATYLDWLFPDGVVADAALQLQANWMADYRNSSGVVVEDGPSGPTVTIEDSSRVDPWIARQAQRAAAECTERLAEFSRRDRPSSAD